jgi:hypothetical protein
VFFLFCLWYLIFIAIKYRKSYNAKYAKFIFVAIIVFFGGC